MVFGLVGDIKIRGACGELRLELFEPPRSFEITVLAQFITL